MPDKAGDAAKASWEIAMSGRGWNGDWRERFSAMKAALLVRGYQQMLKIMVFARRLNY